MSINASRQSFAKGLQRLRQELEHKPARVLLFGPPGSGKSTLAALLAPIPERCHCLNLDPGSPSFGVPAALNLGTWCKTHWQPLAFEPLCSLDAARFRLPLLEAAKALLAQAPAGTLLLDMPGLVRGVAAAELLCALTRTLQPDWLVNLIPDGATTCLPDELRSLDLPQLDLRLADQSRTPTRKERRDQRTLLWRKYLGNAVELCVDAAELVRLGTPPPLDLASAWQGRIVALSDRRGTTAMAEIRAARHTASGGLQLQLCGPALTGSPHRLTVRDAVVDNGGLSTREPVRPNRLPSRPVPAPRYAGESLRIKVAGVEAELINGVFGDPLLLLSLQQSRRCLLFDLGNTRHLPLRCAHRVTDVFISHAHLDHIGGFIGLLRARLVSDNSLCRLYGPPGLAGHIAGMLRGMLWDRIDDRGPLFDIHEWQGDRLVCCRLQAGIENPQALPDRPIIDGILLAEDDFRIRATELDHGTPVLAYAFEPTPDWQVDTAALARSALPHGPWLGQLLEAWREDDLQRPLQLPDGRRLAAGPLAQQLLVAKPVARLAYATDLADTPDNRRRLTALARDADTLFCEACFTRNDETRAREHSHLTTRACGEIAAMAGVRQLVPFHFSKRYEEHEDELYNEIRQATGDSQIELVTAGSA
ncbi:MAG: hypothetical protein HWE39_05050 [Oceanospirillaceae bacterium]|nr:hypothetical protein [Oceanospirillaceae bacterium]